ncbi:MAG: hypothetical protein ACQEUN_16695 [Pseudomonadota bacterium]
MPHNNDAKPYHTLIHIGCGAQPEVGEYRRLAEQIWLIDADSERLATLEAALAEAWEAPQDATGTEQGQAPDIEPEPVHIHQALVDTEKRPATFHRYSLAWANGLGPPDEATQRLYPGLQCLGSTQQQTTPVNDVVAHCLPASAGDSAAHLLLLDVGAQNSPLLRALEQSGALGRFVTVIVLPAHRRATPAPVPPSLQLASLAPDGLTLPEHSQVLMRHPFLEQLTDLTQQRDELKQQLEQRTQERDEKAQQAANATKERDELKQQLEQRTQERDEKAQQAANATKERDEIKQQLAQRTQERDETAQQAANATKKRDELKQQLEQRTQQRDEQGKQAANAAKARDELKQQLEQCTQQRDEASNKADNAAKARDDLKQKLVEYDKQLAERTQQRDEASKKADNAAKARDELKQQLAECDKQLEERTQQRDEKSKQAGRTAKQRDELNQQLVVQQQEYNDRCKKMEQELLKAESQLELIKELFSQEKSD